MTEAAVKRDHSLLFRASRVLNAVYAAVTRKEDRYRIAPVLAEFHGQVAADLIREGLRREEPLMICRFGYLELKGVLTYYHGTRGTLLTRLRKFVQGEMHDFWWEDFLVHLLNLHAGLFPARDLDVIERFCRLMLEDIKQIDILGCWLGGERDLCGFFPNAALVELSDLAYPFLNEEPWSEALEGKTVLVVHPFNKSVEQQYDRRELLFADKRVLPSFELKTIKAVQSSVGHSPGKFRDWFEGFEHMCEAINNTKFDIAIIGCGAYGLPLAAHVKRIGKKAVHLGGATQLLFGIRGRRWDKAPQFSRFCNEYWVRPLAEERPEKAESLEGGAYW